MPYIPAKARKEIDSGKNPEAIGELNYKITKEIMKYLSLLNFRKAIQGKKLIVQNNYADYNEVMGVLECVKQELYRKVISKYEDKKCKLNGDVF
jgi:hypothetical protein